MSDMTEDMDAEVDRQDRVIQGLRDEIERLTAESKAKDVAYETMQEYVTELETRIEVLESQLESGMAGYSMLPTEMLNQLQARVEELEGDVRTHFEHGWSRGFHAGSAQVNTLPSDWRGYRAIIEQGEKDEL